MCPPFLQTAMRAVGAPPSLDRRLKLSIRKTNVGTRHLFVSVSSAITLLQVILVLNVVQFR